MAQWADHRASIPGRRRPDEPEQAQQVAVDSLLLAVRQPAPAPGLRDAIEVGQEIAGLPFGVDDRAVAQPDPAPAREGPAVEPVTEFERKRGQYALAHGYHRMSHSPPSDTGAGVSSSPERARAHVPSSLDPGNAQIGPAQSMTAQS